MLNLGAPNWAIELGLHAPPMRALARRIYFSPRVPAPERQRTRHFKPQSRPLNDIG